MKKRNMMASLLLAGAMIPGLSMAQGGQVATSQGAAPAKAGGGKGSPADIAGVAALALIMQDAYPNRDGAALARYSDPDVHVVLMDGTVLDGRRAVIDFFKAHGNGLSDPGLDLQTDDATGSEPVFLGETAILRGKTREVVTPQGLRHSLLDAPFTVVLVKSPDGPVETNRWVVRSFHSSVSGLANDAITDATVAAVARAKTDTMRFWTIVAGVAGVAVGATGMWILGRRRRRGAARGNKEEILFDT